jgi:hypothetical protein
MSLVDPTGYLLTGIRDNAAVQALGMIVRAGEMAPGDAGGPGHYKRVCVLVRLGASRLKHVPIQEVRYAARNYGLTFQDAAVVAGTVSDAIHAIGHRINGSGVAIFGSFDDGGEGATKDPDTDQPMETVIIQVNAATGLIP